METKSAKYETEISMIGEGKKTGQKIENVYTSNTFDMNAFYTLCFNLISENKKPIESNDLRTYCTGCGT
jgi:hypothetical protein